MRRLALCVDYAEAARVGLEALVQPRDVQTAMTEPPTSTRAYFRGRCLQKFPDDIVAANWDSLVFDIGRDPLRRVPMMEPMRGTRAHVGTVVDESADVTELLAQSGLAERDRSGLDHLADARARAGDSGHARRRRGSRPGRHGAPLRRRGPHDEHAVGARQDNST